MVLHVFPLAIENEEVVRDSAQSFNFSIPSSLSKISYTSEVSI